MNQEVNNYEVNNGRSVAAVLADIKEELKEFTQTRLAMLKAELLEKVRLLKAAAPLAAIGLLLLGTAYLLLTLALVGLVVAFFRDNPYRWCLAFLAVGVLWSVLGGLAAYLATREFAMRNLMPTKTIGVLKADKLWIQSEVKNQL